MGDRPAYLKGRGRGRGKTQQTNNVNSHPGRQDSSGGRGGGRGQANGFGHCYDTNTYRHGGAAIGRNQGQGHMNGVGQGDSLGVPEPAAWGKGRGRGQVTNKKKADIDKQKDESNGPTAEERFQAASDQYQESIKRHMAENDMEDVYSSEEEDDIASNVLENVFSTYSNNDVDISEAQSVFLHSFRSSTSACLVCIETIRKSDPIWCCHGCSAMFHIQCIQRWIREGVYQQMYKSEDDSVKQEDIPWHCPKCRLEYSQQLFPSKYVCFCGKVPEPKFDPWLVPHSCGQTCGKPLKPDCGHTCLLLCHPGSCPPCPKTVQVKCHCGKSSPVVRRCSARPWACGKPCGRLLSCGQHNCQQLCHAGECPPCPKTSKQSCLCGKSTAIRPCASQKWHCEQPCGKRLSCGNHLCEEVCHSGSCKPCPRGGLRQCPCGKTSFDLPCTEDIPTCKDTCGKLLDCNKHKCVQRCHKGPCGSCKQMTVKRCRCSQQKEREVPCYKDFLCDVKCNKPRDCGKHKCNRKCCDGTCPSCEQVCNKLLRCKKHKCLNRCHKGQCYPCMETVDITCNCKATKITVPCGREKSTKPPKCNLKCKKPPTCHHPARLPHRCHFGECPPCKQVCNKQLTNCTHKCPVMCHAAVKVKRRDNTKRAGPWEEGPRVIETIENKPCPPCMMPLEIECYGKHEVGKFACSVIRPYQCGRPCGRELACTNHTCTLMCHTVEGAEDDHKAGTNCQECELPCQFDRPPGCSHECPQPCHPGPCPPCTQRIKMRCHCQTVTKYIECNKWLGAGDTVKNELKSCGGNCPKPMSCGHPCGLLCHTGSCRKPENCQEKVTLKCKCRRQKRDVKCNEMKQYDGKLPCDDVCKQHIDKRKKKDIEEDERRKEEEMRKQQAELEEFERKMKGGRKKKTKKQFSEVEELSFIQRYKVILICCLSFAIIAVIVGYLLNTA